jgi:RimJ/RimL family protein N-acetyltransferase
MRRIVAIDQPIIIRTALQADSERLLAWRNDPVTRAASRNSEVVAIAAHERWLQGVLTAPDRELLVGESSGDPVGQVRFDRLGGERWEISVTVAPHARGRGLGRALVAAGVEWLWAARPDARVVEALVREGNERSLRVFEGCGFVPVHSEDEGFARLERRRD